MSWALQIVLDVYEAVHLKDVFVISAIVFLNESFCSFNVLAGKFLQINVFFSHFIPVTLQVVGGNLLSEAVTWFFTSVLRALQVHGQHEVSRSTLSQLAMLIYENLVRLTVAAISSLHFCLSSD